MGKMRHFSIEIHTQDPDPESAIMHAASEAKHTFDNNATPGFGCFVIVKEFEEKTLAEGVVI